MQKRSHVAISPRETDRDKSPSHLRAKRRIVLPAIAAISSDAQCSDDEHSELSRMWAVLAQGVGRSAMRTPSPLSALAERSPSPPASREI